VSVGSLPVALDDVRAAAARLDGVAHRTPLIHSRALDEVIGASVMLKAESLQRTGSFKFRGAYNRIVSIPEPDRARGVVAISSGNHAQAVALAASLLGMSSTIVMPEDAPAIKLARTREYGAEIVTYDRYGERRDEIGFELAAERGLTLVHPFEDPLVIAGQGTAALELVEAAGEIDLLLVPVSGGGLIAGCAVAAKSLCPDVRVIGVEPELADDYRRSLEAGRRIEIEVPRTIADALSVTVAGELTFAINSELLEGIVVVSESELVEAMRFGFEHLKLVLEPGGAAALAALLAGRVAVPDRARVAVVLSGGNVDVARFAELLGPERLR
jgi:threonine dehydratase